MTVNMSAITHARTNQNVATCGECAPCFEIYRLTLRSCREGLLDAPHSKRKTQGVQQAPAAIPNNANAPKKITRLHSPSQAFHLKPQGKEASPEDLSIHKRSQAGENPPPGGIMKLDTSRPVKRKLRSPSLDHDVAFTDLGYTASLDLPDEWDDSGEDLPETVIPLAKGKEKGQRYFIEVHASIPVDHIQPTSQVTGSQEKRPGSEGDAHLSHVFAFTHLRNDERIATWLNPCASLGAGLIPIRQ